VVRNANVIWVEKEGRAQTWGAKVLPGKVVEKGEEIFVDYGEVYWKTLGSEAWLRDGPSVLP